MTQDSAVIWMLYIKCACWRHVLHLFTKAHFLSGCLDHRFLITHIICGDWGTLFRTHYNVTVLCNVLYKDMQNHFLWPGTNSAEGMFFYLIYFTHLFQLSENLWCVEIHRYNIYIYKKSFAKKTPHLQVCRYTVPTVRHFNIQYRNKVHCCCQCKH